MTDPKAVKYRNDTGGLISIPIPAENSHLVGAISGWVHVDPDKNFSVDCIDGEPVNPSLRVMARAKSGGIRPASETALVRKTGRRTRSLT